MAENVYILPAGTLTGAAYGDQFRVASERAADGALIGANEIAERAPFTVSGAIIVETYADFHIFRDRMRGGMGVAGIINPQMRKTFGWDLIPAFDSAGNEYWRANGSTSGYAGEAANPPTGPYRSINASTVGAHSADDTTIAVDGLLGSEVLPAGCLVRIGDWRYILASTVTANASGEATLTLARGIREALADNDPIRVPGDFMLARMTPGSLRIGEVDANGVAEFSAEFREDYDSEISGGLGSYVLP